MLIWLDKNKRISDPVTVRSMPITKMVASIELFCILAVDFDSVEQLPVDRF